MGSMSPPPLKRSITATPNPKKSYIPQPLKGVNKPLKLDLCQKMVLAKIGGLNISEGVPFILKGILGFFPREPYTL